MTPAITRLYGASKAPEGASWDNVGNPLEDIRRVMSDIDAIANPIEQPCHRCHRPRSAIIHRTLGPTCAQCAEVALHEVLARIGQHLLDRNARRWPSRPPNDSLPYKDD